MTTDAINYLEAIVIGYCLADRTEMSRVFKALPSKNWHGLMGDIARAMDSGIGVQVEILKAFDIRSMPAATQKSSMAIVYEALKDAEAKAGAEKRKPELTKLIASMSNEELDQLDKAYEEMKRVKATKATKAVEESKQAAPASAPKPGAATPVVGKVPDTTRVGKPAEARQG